jgi:hypothetical protein
LQADELGNVLEVLAEDVLPALREHRHRLRAELEQLLMSRRVVQYVDGNEADAFFRKKLFRSQATASAGLDEQDEIVVNAFHLDENSKCLNSPKLPTGRTRFKVFRVGSAVAERFRGLSRSVRPACIKSSAHLWMDAGGREFPGKPAARTTRQEEAFAWQTVWR